MVNLWLQMLGGGLLRADQITEITVHQTPEMAGKAAHWLLNVTDGRPGGRG